MNLTELLENSARRWPQRTAFVEDSTEISYAALAKKIEVRPWKAPAKVRFGAIELLISY